MDKEVNAVLLGVDDDEDLEDWPDFVGVLDCDF